MPRPDLLDSFEIYFRDQLFSSTQALYGDECLKHGPNHILAV